MGENSGEDPRKAQAIQMRLDGMTRSQIAQAFGWKSGGRKLEAWLREVPPPAWTLRPRAKDDLHAVAVAMRREGHSYSEIREVVGVSASSLSLWLKDVPLSEEHRKALEERKVAGRERTRETLRGRRIARDKHTRESALEQVREVAESELFVAGVVAYRAEGSKSKPWARESRVVFTNSDPGMIRLFLAWLQLLEVGLDRCSFRVSIHESADVDASVDYWAGVVGVPAGSFLRTSLKRHNPQTVRKNVGPAYHGCVVVRVRRSAEFGRQIAGWFEGILAALPSTTCKD